MKILVTGSCGFVGKNLVQNLKNQKDVIIYEYDKDNNVEDLLKFTQDCDFVFHLAGVNRTTNFTDFINGNYGLTSELIYCLKQNKNKCPVLFTSSIQAELDNEYGKSKRQAEDVLIQFHNDIGNPILIYRLPNLFGKWCKPNYNSVIATWCYNISHDLEIKIDDSLKIIKLAYIDDVIKNFINDIQNYDNSQIYYDISITYEQTLNEIAELIFSFKNIKNDMQLPKVNEEFTKKLYSTYLSYLDENDFVYELKMNVDNRGSFTECLKGQDGQVSINICKPGITKGNHWHNTKVEKFIVIKGSGQFNFRKVGTKDVISIDINDHGLRVLDIPPGYIHNFVNNSQDDLIVLIWCNEIFDKENPDTFFEEI